MSDTAGPPGLNRLGMPLGPGLPMPGGNRINMPAPNRAFRRNITLPVMQRMANQGPPLQPPPPEPAPAPPGVSPSGPTAGGVGDAPSPHMDFDGSRRTLMQNHTRIKAAYEESGKQLRNLDIIRDALDRLSDKQDMVTMEDIIGEAGKLVAKGIDPVALAGVLADAPQEGGGQALAGWVDNHAANAQRAEQALGVQRNNLRLQLGASGVHLLMAHSNAQQMQGGISPPMGSPQGSGNDLTGAPNPSGPPAPNGNDQINDNNPLINRA